MIVTPMTMTTNQQKVAKNNAEFFKNKAIRDTNRANAYEQMIFTFLGTISGFTFGLTSIFLSPETLRILSIWIKFFIIAGLTSLFMSTFLGLVYLLHTRKFFLDWAKEDNAIFKKWAKIPFSNKRIDDKFKEANIYQSLISEIKPLKSNLIPLWLQVFLTTAGLAFIVIAWIYLLFFKL